MKHHAGALATPRPISGIPTWALALTTVLSLAVSLVSYRYLGAAEEIPPQIAANAFFSPWLAVHAAGAATALLLGPFQFFPALRTRFGRWHRWSGRVYVLGCLVGALTGGLLAVGASTGIVTTAGFGTLAAAWLVTTALAWRRAVQGRIAQHRRWMIRSFSLTLAAVTLRLYLPLADMLALPDVANYQAISFLCWVPNLLWTERYLHRST
jgi:uncharacterized membrane protein